MAEKYFNDDQADHMAGLARIPATERCASGWHHTAKGEKCDCDEFYASVGWTPRNRPPEAPLPPA